MSVLCCITSSRIVEYVKEGTAAVGGEVDKEQLYIAPTILTDVSPKSKVRNFFFKTVNAFDMHHFF